jgi:vancomycin resistance protein YoaR
VLVKDKPLQLTPREMDDYLTMVPAEGALVAELDTQAIVDDLAEKHPKVIKAPVDASWKFPKLVPVVVPGKAGEEIDPETLAPRLLVALASATDRTAVADLREAEPELTTEAAEALGVTEKISSFKTYYPYAAYRVTNIGRAAELIHLSVVLPGETWSLNQTVGERTEANGFVKGYIIKEGRFAEDLGGGVSQSATTTFNAAFFAGLKDVEHHPHSLYISRYPAGREATVAFGSKDLRFENDSPTAVVIRAVHKVGSLKVEFWGTKHWDKIESVSSSRYNIRTPKTIYSSDPDCESQAPVSGFDIDVTRVFYKDGKEAKREKFHTSYLATDRIICGPAPAPKSDPAKGGKPGDDGAGDGAGAGGPDNVPAD